MSLVEFPPRIVTLSAAKSGDSKVFGTWRLTCVPFGSVSVTVLVPDVTTEWPRSSSSDDRFAPARSPTTKLSPPPRPSTSRCSMPSTDRCVPEKTMSSWWPLPFSTPMASPAAVP